MPPPANSSGKRKPRARRKARAKPPKVNDETGYAASTAATDGRRVFAVFANGDLAAFDFDGNLHGPRAWAFQTMPTAMRRRWYL